MKQQTPAKAFNWERTTTTFFIAAICILAALAFYTEHFEKRLSATETGNAEIAVSLFENEVNLLTTENELMNI